MREPVIPVGLLLWFLALSVWLTLSPFELRTDGPLEYALLPRLDVDLFRHVVLLAPVAVVLGAAAHVRGWNRPVLHPWALVTGIAVVLELGQLWVKGRTFAPHDIAAGSLGAWMAIVGTGWALRKGIGHGGVLTVAGVTTFIAVANGVVLFGSFPGENFRLAGWDARYEVLAARERDGTREYDGEIREPRICAGAPPEDLCVGPGAGVAEREGLVRRALETQELTVSAWVRSESADQDGPARIVSFSSTPFRRNVTLAQQGTDLVFRVRTPWTGLNGIRRQFVLPDAVPEGMAVQVRALYSRGQVTMVAEGDGTPVRGGFPDESSGHALEVQKGEDRGGPAFRSPRGSVAGAGLLFVGLGLGIAWWLRARGPLRWIAGPVVAVVGLYVYRSLVLPWGPPPVGAVLFASVTALVGAGLAVLDQTRWRQ